MSEALKALLNYEQADEEGVMVLASREAIHVVSGELDTALTRIRELEGAFAALRDDPSTPAWIQTFATAALSSKDQEKTNG